MQAYNFRFQHTSIVFISQLCTSCKIFWSSSKIFEHCIEQSGPSEMPLVAWSGDVTSLWTILVILSDSKVAARPRARIIKTRSFNQRTWNKKYPAVQKKQCTILYFDFRYLSIIFTSCLNDISLNSFDDCLEQNCLIEKSSTWLLTTSTNCLCWGNVMYLYDLSQVFKISRSRLSHSLSDHRPMLIQWYYDTTTAYKFNV